jgi:hypothetical protein
MIPKRIQNATRVLGAPADWKDEGGPCAGIPVADVSTPEGPFMVSAWEMTPAEVQAVINGASVRLWIRGISHPVVVLDVSPVDNSAT